MWYDHNDIDSLTNVLATLTETFREKKHRVYVLSEGLFQNHGDICKLDKIVKLREQFPFRILLDETYSIGALGHTGRGLVELYGLDRDDVAITIGGLNTAFGGIGGFACGSVLVCDHMVLV